MQQQQAEILTVDFFDGTALTVVGSSAPFTAGSDDWVTVPVADVPFIGSSAQWLNGITFHQVPITLVLDEDGPYSAEDLEWYYDGTTWDKIWIAAGSSGPGVFGVRATALVGGDLKTDHPCSRRTADRPYHKCLSSY